MKLNIVPENSCFVEKIREFQVQVLCFDFKIKQKS